MRDQVFFQKKSIAAITDEYQTLPHVPEEEKSESEKAHFMLDTFDIFEDSKQTKTLFCGLDGDVVGRFGSKGHP